MDGSKTNRLYRIERTAMKSVMLYKGTPEKCLTFAEIMEERAKRQKAEEKEKKRKEFGREERQHV